MPITRMPLLITMEEFLATLASSQYPQVSSLSPQEQSNRIKGSIFASALGDALGLYTEMIDHDSAIRMWDSLGGLSFENWTQRPHIEQFQRGDWTDDTDLALTIVDSFVETGGVDLGDLRRRGKEWLDSGYPELGDVKGIGTGSTITTSLTDPISLLDPHSSALLTWCELGNFDLGTSGAVMRTGPVALCHYRNLPDLVQHSVNIGAITHADPRSVAACVSIDVAIGSILMGDSVQVAHERAQALGQQALAAYTRDIPTKISKAAETLQSDPVRRANLVSQYELQSGSVSERSAFEPFQSCFTHTSLASIPEICSFSRDYAYKILSIAFWALHQSRPYEHVLLDIVKEGGDADTNAAVAGAVYGAVVGFDALPVRLVQGLRHREWLQGKVDRLLERLGLPVA